MQNFPAPTVGRRSFAVITAGTTTIPTNAHAILKDRDFMAEYNVAADIKIYVSDPAKMDTVKSEIEKIVKVQQFKEEELGFGIKVLKATLLLNDEKGGMDAAEKKIKEIDSVSQIEVENVTRI